MKIKGNQRGLDGGFTGLLAVVLFSVSALLFASSFQAIPPAAPDASDPTLPAIATDPTPTLGNYPDISIPLSADTTVTPDAPPANTTAINVSTSTNFKGKLEAYPTTGVVRVTDAHPAGTYTVTVKAFNGNGPTTTKTFTLTVRTVMCIPMLFSGATNFGVGTGASPNLVAVGDFNGDGKQDLAVSNTGFTGGVQANVSILLGDGVGSFNLATNFEAGVSPYSVAVSDFNGDGKQDLAVANSVPGTVSILLGDGQGQFSSPTSFDVGSYPYAVVAGDFNGDGKPDLVAVHANSSGDHLGLVR